MDWSKDLLHVKIVLKTAANYQTKPKIIKSNNPSSQEINWKIFFINHLQPTSNRDLVDVNIYIKNFL